MPLEQLWGELTGENESLKATISWFDHKREEMRAKVHVSQSVGRFFLPFAALTRANVGVPVWLLWPAHWRRVASGHGLWTLDSDQISGEPTGMSLHFKLELDLSSSTSFLEPWCRRSKEPWSLLIALSYYRRQCYIIAEPFQVLRGHEFGPTSEVSLFPAYPHGSTGHSALSFAACTSLAPSWATA